MAGKMTSSQGSPTVSSIHGSLAVATCEVQRAIDITALLVSQTPAPPALGFGHLGSDAVLQAPQMRCWHRILAGGI